MLVWTDNLTGGVLGHDPSSTPTVPAASEATTLPPLVGHFNNGNIKKEVSALADENDQRDDNSLSQSIASYPVDETNDQADSEVDGPSGSLENGEGDWTLIAACSEADSEELKVVRRSVEEERERYRGEERKRYRGPGPNWVDGVEHQEEEKEYEGSAIENVDWDVVGRDEDLEVVRLEECLPAEWVPEATQRPPGPTRRERFVLRMSDLRTEVGQHMPEQRVAEAAIEKAGYEIVARLSSLPIRDGAVDAAERVWVISRKVGNAGLELGSIVSQEVARSVSARMKRKSRAQAAGVGEEQIEVKDPEEKDDLAKDEVKDNGEPAALYVGGFKVGAVGFAVACTCD
jgi:hypothetical protein